MNSFFGTYRIALCLLFLASGILRADWEVIKYQGGEYVTLRSFCKFYKLSYPESNLDQEEITLKNATTQLRLRKGSRNCFLNGTRVWSTYNIIQIDSDWLISRKDVSKFFEPILRPSNIPNDSGTRGVVIDAGHGGDDRGAVSRKGIREKDMTLDTAFRLEKILKSRGIATVLTRRKDTFIELEQRAAIAARYPDYIFVSIHFNDASGSARGIETYCFPPLGASSTEYEGRVFKRDSILMPGNKFDMLNIFLATSIHQEIIKLNPKDEEADRGVKRARFVVLKENQLPAVLIEGGFLSNRTESSRISTAEYRDSLAEKIANGIEFFFNRGLTPQRPVNVNRPVAPPAPVSPTILVNDPSKSGVPPSTNSATKTVPLLSTNSPAKTAPSISTNNPVKSSPIIPAISPVKVIPSTNQTPTVGVTNLIKTVPPIKETKETNSLSNAVTNRLMELPTVSTPLSVTNSISAPQSLDPMTNSPATTNLDEKPFVLTPDVAPIGTTNLDLEVKAPQPESEKREEPAPIPPSSPLKPKPEAQEDLNSGSPPPEVEIYMQGPMAVRVPEVSIRPSEGETNAPVSSPEVKP